MFTFDAGGGVGKKIVATSLETTSVGVSSAAGRRLSLAAVQAAVVSSVGAAPATPMVEKTVMVPVYPQPAVAQVAAAATAATAGASAASSDVAVTSPIADPPPPTATQRRISFVVQEDVAAAAQVSELVSDSLRLNDGEGRKDERKEQGEGTIGKDWVSVPFCSIGHVTLIGSTFPLPFLRHHSFVKCYAD